MTRPPPAQATLPGAGGYRPFDATLTSSGTPAAWHQPAQRHRAAATRYDKLAVRYEAIVHIAAINESSGPTYEQGRAA
jgi:hypothetical protein